MNNDPSFVKLDYEFLCIYSLIIYVNLFIYLISNIFLCKIYRILYNIYTIH